MLWFLAAVLAYLLLALAALGDKALLAGPLRTPATYAVAVGGAGILVPLLTPFLGFPLPSGTVIALALASGAAFITALLPYYHGIQAFEVSRMVTATGGLVPIFTLVLGLLLLPGGQALTPGSVLALALLIVGSVTMTYDRTKRVTRRSFVLATLASFLFAFSFLLLKSAYLQAPFWSVFFWAQLGGASGALILLALSAPARSDVAGFLRGRRARGGRPLRTTMLFLLTQGSAAAGSILQSASFYLAPAAAFAFVNALQGTQYVFLLLLASALSARYPHVFLEMNSGKTLAQKILGILLVVAGTILLVVAHPSA